MNVLVCNAGSTSLKFKLYNMPEERILAEGKIECIGSFDNAIFHYFCSNRKEKVLLYKQDIATYSQGILLFLDYLLDKDFGVLKDITQIERIGFKTVLAKGYYGVHELTPEVLAAMEECIVIAPAHNKPYLEAINHFQMILPDVMLVGVFETAFHTTIPMERRLYGIPYEWYKEYGIQRFGYHGASHSYISSVISEKEGNTGTPTAL